MLDTHALVWWVSDDTQLSVSARAALDSEQTDPTGQIVVSAITASEIAMLQQRGRLVLSMDLDEWLVAVESIDNLSVVLVSARVAVQSTRLPGAFHKDPADRIIVAQARELNASLLSAKKKFATTHTCDLSGDLACSLHKTRPDYARHSAGAYSAVLAARHRHQHANG